MIFLLCSSASQLNIMCIWLSFQTEKALFNALRVIFYFTHNRLLHLMTTSLCFGSNEGYHALLRIDIRRILLIWNCDVKIWCYLMLKKQRSDVNDTDLRGNTGAGKCSDQWQATESLCSSCDGLQQNHCVHPVTGCRIIVFILWQAAESLCSQRTST